MSIHSYIMARIIDETKIERIKEATLYMVVSKGYGGASISEIAKQAGVAEGYLYRHYKSKADLVNDLLFYHVNEIMDKLEKLLDNQYSVKEIFEHLTRGLFDLAINHPVRIKFLYVLMHDYNFKVQEMQRQRIFNLCSRVKEMGQKSGEIRKDIDEEEIYLLSVAYPIQFINLRLKNFFNLTQLGENELQKVSKIYLNLI
jgi:TetR/AcrR family transcriptional regulator, repressor of fatR-cypB operon